MAVTTKLLFARKQAEASQTTQYTVPAGTKAIIDKFTVTNTSASTQSISVNLAPSGGSASNANLILKARAIAPNETYTCPELVGQVLETGHFISTIATGAAALTMSAAGREIS